MNEAETRAEYINPKLKASGWCVVGELKKNGIAKAFNGEL